MWLKWSSGVGVAGSLLLGFALNGVLSLGTAASAPRAAPQRFVPVSRLGAEARDARDFPAGLQVEARVEDSRGQVVPRGFASFVLPLVGWCGSEPRRLGRVAFTGGQLRMSLPGPQRIHVVAEDGRAARVSVEKGVGSKVTLTVVLPDHPSAPVRPGKALPWALPERPPYRVAILAMPGTSRAEHPQPVPPELVAVLDEQLRDAGFVTQTVPTTSASTEAVRECHRGRGRDFDACAQRALQSISAESVIVLANGALGRVTYSEVELAATSHRIWGDFQMERDLVAQGRQVARWLVDTHLWEGRWGATRQGPPRDACEYLAGARFERVDSSGDGSSVIDFPAGSPKSFRLRGERSDNDPLDCDGWQLVSRQGHSGPPRLLGTVDPLTGRLTLDRTEYVRAGVVRPAQE
ncbi:hypothetical protein D7Y11_23350 [Corallococcus sp. AB018]|uniref:hypothetical protein n=1 Tax=Corallococcus TaxID=83461 RepID=UPI000F87C5A0|nr:MULTISPECIES: hypothetical protein [Corallococcus]NRD53793.1 hypothetical protein [Corallococcus exiguus]RUO90780.1 hypothetical protein D7Y11_23350 [Corallococcus sp. AB018]